MSMLSKFSEEDISMYEGAIGKSGGKVKAAKNVKFK
jgi:hypothetical protein